MNYIYLNKNVIIYLLIVIFMIIILFQIYRVSTTIREGKINLGKTFNKALSETEKAANELKEKAEKAGKDAMKKISEAGTQFGNAVENTRAVQAIKSKVEQTRQLIEQASQQLSLEEANRLLKEAKKQAQRANEARKKANINVATGLRILEEARERANNAAEDVRDKLLQDAQTTLNGLLEIKRIADEAGDAINQTVNQAAEAVKNLAEQLAIIEKLFKQFINGLDNLFDSTRNTLNFIKNF